MKNFGWIIILVLVSSRCFGQREFGLKGGLNLAALKVSVNIPGQGYGSATTNTLTAFCVGAYFRYAMGEMASFQPEFMYSTQGGAATNSAPQFKIDYMIVPLMFLFRANDMLSLQAGPQVGFLLNAQIGGASVTKEMNPIDVALDFGVGFQFTEAFDATFRVVLGLTNAASNANTTGYPAGTTLSMINQVTQLTLGYKISR